MQTKLLHSGSSSSLASTAKALKTEEISAHPSSAEYVFHSPPKNQTSWKDSQKPDDETTGSKRGWLLHKFRRHNLERIFPLLLWLPQYSLQKCLADLIAGLTVGLTVLPQALAYATVAGLPPVYGLYSSFFGPLVYILFGGTKAITIGPTAINSILTYKYTLGKSPEYAIFLTFITGIVCTFMALCKLSFVANFISSPVISGFTSAVAFTTFATQIKALLGLKFPGEGFLPTMKGLFENWQNINRPDAILSIICCTVLIFLKFVQPLATRMGNKSPFQDKCWWLLSTSRSALVIVGAAVYAYTLDHPPFALVGKVPSGVPEFKVPPFTITDSTTNVTSSTIEILEEQASALIVLPIMTIMGHISIAKAFAGTGRVDATQETLCIGVVNLIGSFFSNFPVGGSFSRTTVNAMSGVETPMGGIFTGIMVLIALQFLTPYFYFIPKASLASVISCCVIFMVDPFIIKPMWKSKPMDLIPLALTFFVTLFVGLEHGIGIGLISSTLYLLYYSARPRVKILQGESDLNHRFVLVRLDRSLTFPSVDYITYEITKAGLRYGDKDCPVVVDCSHIQFADYTAGEGMRDLVLRLNQNGIKIIFWKMKKSVLRVLAGVMEGTGARFVHCETEEQVEKLVDGVVGYKAGMETAVN